MSRAVTLASRTHPDSRAAASGSLAGVDAFENDEDADRVGANFGARRTRGAARFVRGVGTRPGRGVPNGGARTWVRASRTPIGLGAAGLENGERPAPLERRVAVLRLEAGRGAPGRGAGPGCRSAGRSRRASGRGAGPGRAARAGGMAAERRSARRLLGRDSGRAEGEDRRVAVGRVAVGRVAVGRVAVGRVAVGRVAVGRVAVGRVAVGRVAVGRVAVGRVAVGRVAAGVDGRRVRRAARSRAAWAPASVTRRSTVATGAPVPGRGAGRRRGWGLLRVNITLPCPSAGTPRRRGSWRRRARWRGR